MSVTVYGFEAKSIQSYILESNKLKEMVGASEQVENLCGLRLEGDPPGPPTLLEHVLAALGLGLGQPGGLCFSRAAGGVFCAIFEEKAQAHRFRALWTLAVQQFAPRLSFADGLATGDRVVEAIQAVTARQWASRGVFRPELPLAGPLVARNPRTDMPARYPVDCRHDDPPWSENLDAASFWKRQYAKGHLLTDKFDLGSDGGLVWPLGIAKDDEEPGAAQFPFPDERRDVAVIHADGNALGKLLLQLRESISRKPKHYAQAFLHFSRAMERATRAAASKACAPLVAHAEGQVMPARPLILGGDDLTIIVRADLALPFARDFLEAFEERTRQEFEAFNRFCRDNFGVDPQLPPGLSACAGVAFVKIGQPFYQAYQLTEKLCAFSKRGAKSYLAGGRDIPSCLAFQRVTSAVIEDVTALWSHAEERGEIHLNLQPYKVGRACQDDGIDLPALGALDDLCGFLEKGGLSKRTLRELARLLRAESPRVGQLLRRLREHLEEETYKALRHHFETLVPDPHTDYSGESLIPLLTQSKRSPLGDALAWLSMGWRHE